MAAVLKEAMAAAAIQAPAALRACKGWLLWRFEQFDDEPKPRKVPYYAGGGKRFGVQGNPQDRDNLVTFDVAMRAYQSGRYDGIGLAMLTDWGMVALDFDDCVAGGVVDPRVASVVAGTYCELSPSGRGVRAFVHGALPDKKSRAREGSFGFETFHAKGFVTITGNALDICTLVGDEDTVAPLSPAVTALYTERFGAARLVAAAPAGETEADALLLTHAPKLGAKQEDLRAWLDEIDADCDYDTWSKAGMALHHESDGEPWGLDIWDAWSANGSKYPGHDALESKWASFGRQTGTPVTARMIRRAAGVAASKGAPILDAKDVMGTARSIIDQEYQGDSGNTLVRTRGLWYEHAGPCYAEKPDESVRASMWRFLDGALKYGKQGAVEAFNPSKGQVDSALDALRAQLLVENVAPPCWFPGYSGPDAAHTVSVTNGLLHIPTRRLLPHSVGFFTLNTLPYAWDEQARCAEWLAFLDRVWPDDQESKDALQEMFGYLLTPDTSQQKMFLLVGPKRSGKGTIGRVLSALIGRENVVSPTLTSLTTQFGLEPLIDKLVALIPDARVGAQSNTQAIVERLLMVSGEDRITVDRKNKTAWSGTMSARFVVLTNETPQLGDASGALAGRFITIAMQRSFFGQEDLGLTARLLAELPGIFQWALEGRARLQARRFFTQPESGLEQAEELAELSSPVSAFVKDYCECGSAYEVEASTLYEAWRSWCSTQGRDHAGTAQTFGKMLRAANPQVSHVRPRVAGGGQIRCYRGIRLNPLVSADLNSF
ncbi:phage/plasmid primase, P4 family [Cupriavidus sp. CuC1]|uniref:phage/plasmid primase, P4 family n=1 Tax=Cupriavidus sp. CuC1 TaxID=3373131 RepID=UPI0037D1C51F